MTTHPKSRRSSKLWGGGGVFDGHADNSSRKATGAAATKSSDPLTHDFGVLPPGSVVSWDYPIANASGFTWTIDKVHVLCSCTVPSVSSPMIAPGKEEVVTLELDCGDDVADIAKTATVQFKEAAAPPVRLLIKASVRAPMTPSARDVAFGERVSAFKARRTFWLMNFTETPWKAVHVDSCPTWLSAEVAAQRETAAPDNDDSRAESEPLERWRVSLSLDATQLGKGYHQGLVKFRSDSGRHCEVPVWLYQAPRVDVAPAALTFGPAPAGSRVTRSARLIFSEDTTAPAPSAVVATAEGLNVSTRIESAGPRILAVHATITLAAREVENGTLHLRFPGLGLADMAVPIRVHRLKSPPVSDRAEAQ